MGIVFVWRKEYAVGDAVIDAQHRSLFDLGNEIHELDARQAKLVVMKLYNYALAHFKTEEAHMERLEYPGLADHKKHHDQFVADLNAITETFTESSLEALEQFVYNWLVDHILNEDKRYFVFTNKKATV